MSRPRISPGLRLGRRPGSSASLIPPALPRPPVSTCAFTTTGPPSSSAAASRLVGRRRQPARRRPGSRSGGTAPCPGTRRDPTRGPRVYQRLPEQPTARNSASSASAAKSGSPAMPAFAAQGRARARGRLRPSSSSASSVAGERPRSTRGRRAERVLAVRAERLARQATALSTYRPRRVESRRPADRIPDVPDPEQPPQLHDRLDVILDPQLADAIDALP